MRQQLDGYFVQEDGEPTWWQRTQYVFNVPCAEKLMLCSVVSCGTKQTLLIKTCRGKRVSLILMDRKYVCVYHRGGETRTRQSTWTSVVIIVVQN